MAATMTQAAAGPLAPPTSAGRELPLLRIFTPSRDENSAVSPSRPKSAEPFVLTDELRAEIEHENQRLESAQPQEILSWVTSRFGDRFTMATAFGPEGMVLIHMLAEVAPKTAIFNL